MIGTEDLTAIFILDSLSGFGPIRFRRLWEQGVRPRDAVEKPELLPVQGKQDEAVLHQLRHLDPSTMRECEDRASKQIEAADEASATILSYVDRGYPGILRESHYPVPVLYARGDVGALATAPTVACVGSRKIRAPYQRSFDEFAYVATKLGFAIVSGFALGADSVGHRRALAEGAPTIAVMAGGLDRPFPPENKELWNTMLHTPGACFVSEMGFGVRASSMNLRKRNKLIVALSHGVVVGQSALRGGAMNAYRFAIEERKPVATFFADGEDDTSGNAFMAIDDKSRGLVTELPIADAQAWRKWLRQL